MMGFKQSERCQKVASAKPDEAAKLVYQWVKNDVINLREFKELYPLIDQEVECDKCGGTRGGVPGNEQLCGIMCMCDNCAADWRRDPDRLLTALEKL